MKIAWIGTGVMGSAMACHLQKAGHEVKAYNRTGKKAEALQAVGIRAMKTIADCVADCEVVFTMVGEPHDVEAVYYGEQGILAHAPKGAYLIDMTTSAPSLARRIAHDAHDFHVLDAPVSGGDIGAQKGTLTVMCGGDHADFVKMEPLFSCFAETITHQGEAGSGQHCKACNQIALAGCIASAAEALTYARTSGLDPKQVLAAIAKGAAGSFQLTHNGEKMLCHDYEPGFYIKHFIKDMNIAAAELKQMDLHFPILTQVQSIYETLREMGYDDAGTQAIWEYYQSKQN